MANCKMLDDFAVRRAVSTDISNDVGGVKRHVSCLSCDSGSQYSFDRQNLPWTRFEVSTPEFLIS